MRRAVEAVVGKWQEAALCGSRLEYRVNTKFVLPVPGALQARTEVFRKQHRFSLHASIGGIYLL